MAAGRDEPVLRIRSCSSDCVIEKTAGEVFCCCWDGDCCPFGDPVPVVEVDETSCERVGSGGLPVDGEVRQERGPR